MKGKRLFSRKGWATLMAAVLVLSLALTGTLAWRSISQVARNDFRTTSNPGGRLHDDLNGTENKDVYVENFTDTATGVPVFARIRLLEYMETGDDAGVNRDATDRHAESILDGANINTPSTWHIHKPSETATDDPFHTYWTWNFGGSTVYMPTFNKNKDSLSVDVNGTYAGTDKNFNTGTPYDDYLPHTLGETPTTAFAYYDADSNEDDEYDPTAVPAQAPGGGGTEWSTTNPTGNYTKTEETHATQSTLNGLGVLTMQEWKDKGCPVGNYWVWDTDGWAYWAKPIMPQTATGLFLTKVTEKTTPAEKSYYAIEVMGQFATAFQWGVEGTDDPGFYTDGFTPDAKMLLDQAANVKVGEDGNWYLPKGQNVFVQILDDEGNLGDPVCAGEDGDIGTPDDNKNVIHIPGGIDIGDKHYGDYFLKPTEDEPYYKAPGSDNELGKEPDDKLWVPDGGRFPDDAVDSVADGITINGPAELEVGSANIAYTASVKLGAADSFSQAVTWTLTTTTGDPVADGTTLTADGHLTVAEGETSSLVITATSKLDKSVTASKTVKVMGKPNIKITLQSDGSTPTQIQAGKSMQLQAKLYYGSELAETQPSAEDYTWEAAAASRAVDVDRPVMSETVKGLLTVGRNVRGRVIVTAAYTGRDVAVSHATLSLLVQNPDGVTVELAEDENRTAMDAGQSLTYTATLSNTDELATTDVNWSVGSSTDSGATLTEVAGVSISTAGVLTVKSDGTYTATSDKILYVKATPKDTSAGDAVGVKAVTVRVPDTVELTLAEGQTAKAKQTETRDFTATVKDGARSYTAQDVTWSLEGNTSDSTTIIDGKLQIAADENNRNHKFKVLATSKINPNAKAEFEITVTDGKFYVDDIEFLILKNDTVNHKALIITKYVVDDGERFDDNHGKWYNNPGIRTFMIDWLDSKPTLKDAALETTIYTRKEWNSGNSDDDFEETTDKIFLLSEADLYGTYNHGTVTDLVAKDYTDGVGKLTDPSGQNWVAYWNPSSSSGEPWWLRSQCLVSDCLSVVDRDGELGSGLQVNNYSVRPALWVDTTKIDLPES